MTLTVNQKVAEEPAKPSSAKPDCAAYDVGASTNIRWHESRVSRDDKQKLLKQRGCVLWFTGLSGSGKSTVACTLEHTLNSMGKFTVNLDGDNIRHGVSRIADFQPSSAVSLLDLTVFREISLHKCSSRWSSAS